MTNPSHKGWAFLAARALCAALIALHGCSSDDSSSGAPTGDSQQNGGDGGNASSGSSGTNTTSNGHSGSPSPGGGEGGGAGSTQNTTTGGTGGGGGSTTTRTDAGAAGSAGTAKADAGKDASTTGYSPPQCLNGKKDGDESGVDCGGSCPACPNYKINAPRKDDGIGSACGGGTGYMCARSMVFSLEMKQAALDDWGMPDPPFVYGTVGHDADNGGLDNGNTCCQCYQLVFESAEGASSIPAPKPMIVQTFNTAAGGGKNFDVYMAAGGYGAQNGCTKNNAMYDKYPDLGGDYTGGVRASRYQQCGGTLMSISSMTCQSYIESQCNMITSSGSSSNQSTSRQSCIETNQPVNLYHNNWTVRAKRVECPDGLTRVTGCKPNSQGLPKADPNAQTAATADSSFRTGYKTTTMQDCCRPTCAYPGNVSNTDGSYSVFYTCDKAGNPQ